MCKRKSTPPPAHNLVVLSADLLAVAAKKACTVLATGGRGTFEEWQQLKQALETYESVRMGGILKDDDPQCCQLNDPPAPTTERSIHHA